jgi:hypothetical protein
MPYDKTCLSCEGSANNCINYSNYFYYLTDNRQCNSCESSEKFSDPRCSFSKELKLRKEVTAPDRYSSNTIEVCFDK